jgi:single-stranded-DNA-specific exonuclease
VLAQVFSTRGLRSPDDLALGLSHLLSPAGFLGLPEAAALLSSALLHREKILFVGDFDADGATSIAVGLSLLQAMGAADVEFLVPNRFDYGYGLSPEIVELARQRNPAVLVTVDNGISSIAGVARASELGIRTLVTDHHLPGDELPRADVIVNPNQPGCGFPSKNLAGVGVIFYVMSALRRHLQEQGWFERQGLSAPSLAQVLDLVALGTVADVVPLDRNNRILVQQGLMRIRAGETRPGIRALLEIAGRSLQRLVASDLAFAVAPRLNAAGRLDDMTIGINCLLAEDMSAARQTAAQLDSLNQERRQIEQTMQQQAEGLLTDLALTEDVQARKSVCLYQPGWHQGVVGIVASRVKDKLHRPVIAFAEADDGVLKGSARSIPGLHIRDALERVSTEHPGLIEKFGGHAMAAGLSLPGQHFERFRDALEAAVTQLIDEEHLQSVILSDGALDASALDLGLARELRYAAPWGQHFPEPLFDGTFTVVQQRIVGGRHLKLVLSPADDPGLVLDAIAFNVDLTQWPDASVERVSAAYRLDCNFYRGEESLQLMVEYLAPAAGG